MLVIPFGPGGHLNPFEQNFDCKIRKNHRKKSKSGAFISSQTIEAYPRTYRGNLHMYNSGYKEFPFIMNARINKLFIQIYEFRTNSIYQEISAKRNKDCLNSFFLKIFSVNLKLRFAFEMHTLTVEPSIFPLYLYLR